MTAPAWARVFSCLVIAVLAVIIELAALAAFVLFADWRIGAHIDPNSARDRRIYETLFVAVVVIDVAAAAWASWVLGRILARAPLTAAMLSMVLTGAALVLLRDGISGANDCAVGIAFPTDVTGCD